jgi:hypothetical protein
MSAIVGASAEGLNPNQTLSGYFSGSIGFTEDPLPPVP